MLRTLPWGGSDPGIHKFYICIDLGPKKSEKELD